LSASPPPNDLINLRRASERGAGDERAASGIVRALSPRRAGWALRCDGHCDHQLDRNVGATSLQSVTSDVPGIGLNLEMSQVGAYSQRTVGSETCSGVAVYLRGQVRSGLHSTDTNRHSRHHFYGHLSALCLGPIHFFPFILLTLTVVCSILYVLVCCKYSLSVSLPFW